MRLKLLLMLFPVSTMLFSCADTVVEETNPTTAVVENPEFNYQVEEFADIKVLRYQIPGWEDLTLKEQRNHCYKGSAAGNLRRANAELLSGIQFPS